MRNRINTLHLNEDQSSDANIDTEGIPWWVRASYRYGLSMILALGLTIFMAWQVSQDLSAMRIEHKELGFYLRAICF